VPGDGNRLQDQREKATTHTERHERRSERVEDRGRRFAQ